MTACGKIKFGTLILVTFLMYTLLGRVDPTKTATWSITWNRQKGYYCPTKRISISCMGQYILIQDAYEEIKSERQNLSDTKLSFIKALCNCQTDCRIPRNQKCFYTTFRGQTWTLYIKFQCTNNDCSDSTGRTTSPSPGNHSITTSLSEATTEAETNVPLSSVAGTSYNTAVHTTNKKQFNLYSDTDEKSTDKVAIVVCVSVIGFGIAGFILAVILYRRWRKKKIMDYIYNNNTTSENTDTGFTNLTYSETSGKDDVKHDDTKSHSADNGYTDMRIDETLGDTNDDYYSIKDGKEETLQPENDNYYAIKDNVGQEYNKITFRPKSIPEDPSYVHTLRATNIKDKTYDHVDGKESTKSELPHDDYSHLNQCKDHSFNTIRCSPIGEAFKEDGAAVRPNEKGDIHKYFTLEMDKYLRQTEVDKENNLSHGYFVLETKVPTNFADGNDVSKKNVKLNTVVAVQDNDPSASSADHVYFENCHQADADSDSHQYQALEPHTSDRMEKSVEIANHDYFVLDKEINATDTDKETDTSHNYFVLEEEILAKNNLKDDNDFSKTHATVHATSAVKEMKHSTSSTDQTYFEDRLQVGNASDTHQYQTLEQHIMEPDDECLKDIHD